MSQTSAQQAQELRNERLAKQREKAMKEARKAAVDAKIARLQHAKKQVTAVKSDVGTLKKNVKGKENQEDTWQGYHFTWYDDFVPGTFRSDYDAYHKELDTFLDAICDKITQLENESRDLGAGINWLVNALNSIGNAIEKLFN